MDRLLNLTAPPLTDALVEPRTGRLTDIWRQWFGRMPDTHGAIPSLIGRVLLQTQAATIAATRLNETQLLAGSYRVSYRLQVTRAASTSSSLTFALHWTCNGVGQTETGAAVTGNATTTGQTGTSILIVDNATNITYTVTYASSGATTMQYRVAVNLEKIRV